MRMKRRPRGLRRSRFSQKQQRRGEGANGWRATSLRVDKWVILLLELL